MGHGQEEVIDVALATAVRTDTWLVIENLQLASRLWLEQLYNRLSRLQLQAGAYYFDVGGERMVLKVRWGGRSFFAQCWTLWTRKRELGSVCMIPEWISFRNDFRSRVKFVLLSSDLARVVFAPVKYVCATRARVYNLRFKIPNRVRFQFTWYQNLYRNDVSVSCKQMQRNIWRWNELVPEWKSFRYHLNSPLVFRTAGVSVTYTFEIVGARNKSFKAMRSTQLVWLWFSWTSFTTLNLRNHCHHFTLTLYYLLVVLLGSLQSYLY